MTIMGDVSFDLSAQDGHIYEGDQAVGFMLGLCDKHYYEMDQLAMDNPLWQEENKSE
jgi:hypothetical protein